MEQETAVDASTPDNLWRSTRPDPAGVEALASLLLKSKKPAIIAGDDVARSGAEQALVALGETIGASVWFEGLRHHASFPTSHPSYRQSLPGDARQVRKALGDTDLVLLIGGPVLRGHLVRAGWPHCRRRVRCSRSRLLPNVSRSTIGSMPASSATSPSASRALTNALRARRGADFRQAAQSRNAVACRTAGPGKGSLSRARGEELEPSSRARCRA